MIMISNVKSDNISNETFYDVNIELFFECNGRYFPGYGYREKGIRNFGYWSWSLIEALTDGECVWDYLDCSRSIVMKVSKELDVELDWVSVDEVVFTFNSTWFNVESTFFDVLKGMEANVLQQNKVIASYLHRVAMPLKHTRLRLQGAEGVYAIPTELIGDVNAALGEEVIRFEAPYWMYDSLDPFRMENRMYKSLDSFKVESMTELLFESDSHVRIALASMLLSTVDERIEMREFDEGHIPRWTC